MKCSFSLAVFFFYLLEKKNSKSNTFFKIKWRLMHFQKKKKSENQIDS